MCLSGWHICTILTNSIFYMGWVIAHDGVQVTSINIPPSSVAQKPSPCLVWQLTCQVKTHQPHLRIQRFHKEKFQVEIVKCAIKRWLLHPWKGTWQPSTGWSWESRLNVKPVENFSRAKTDLISIRKMLYNGSKIIMGVKCVNFGFTRN